MRNRLPKKAHEVTTIRTLNGVGRNYFVKKYIVIARTTSRAIDLTPLSEGEEVLSAKELIEHQVILESRR